MTPDDEKQAITELALQQFADRDIGVHRPDDVTQLTAAAASPEEMRNRALAELAARQARMARENPMPRPPGPAPSPGGSAGLPGAGSSRPPAVARRGARSGVVSPTGPPVVQRTSGMTVSPRLTVAPTLTSAKRVSPVPEEVLKPRAPAVARSRQESRVSPVPEEVLKPRAPAVARSRQESRKRQPPAGAGPAPVARSVPVGRVPPVERVAPEAPAVTPRVGRSPKVVATPRDAVKRSPAHALAEVAGGPEPMANGRRETFPPPVDVRVEDPVEAPARDYDPDEAVAASAHCMLAALSMLLGSFEVLPPPRYDERARAGQYDEIAENAAGLRELVEQFLDELPD